MAVLSDRSKKELATCHPELRRLMEAVASELGDVGFEVICGHRNKSDQMKAYYDKKSKLKWPESRHNSLPSQAVDLVPLPIDWKNRAAFHRLSKLIKAVAEKMQIDVVWGGDWLGFPDLPHWQLGRPPGKAGKRTPSALGG